MATSLKWIQILLTVMAELFARGIPVEFITIDQGVKQEK